jgi:hypothetical protein
MSIILLAKNSKELLIDVIKDYKKEVLKDQNIPITRGIKDVKKLDPILTNDQAAKVK